MRTSMERLGEWAGLLFVLSMFLLAPCVGLYLLIFTPTAWLDCLGIAILTGFLVGVAANALCSWFGMLALSFQAQSAIRTMLAALWSVVWIVGALALACWCGSFFVGPYPGLLSTMMFFGLLSVLWMLWRHGGLFLAALIAGEMD